MQGLASQSKVSLAHGFVLSRVSVDQGCHVLGVGLEHVRAAIAAGVKICISSDAHHPDGIDVLRYGVDCARRGWATADDIVNTRSWPDLQALRKPTRHSGPGPKMSP